VKLHIRAAKRVKLASTSASFFSILLDLEFYKLCFELILFTNLTENQHNKTSLSFLSDWGVDLVQCKIHKCQS